MQNSGFGFQKLQTEKLKDFDNLKKKIKKNKNKEPSAYWPGRAALVSDLQIIARRLQLVIVLQLSLS